MAEVFRIQTALELGGNLAPETIKLLRTMEKIETKAKAIPRELRAWERPILDAARAVERLASAMSRVSRAGAKRTAPQNDIVKWASASAKELGATKKAAQGVGTAARGVGRSFESWEGKINKATRALERMERVASSMRMPAMPAAPQGGYGRGGSQRGSGNSGHGGSSSRRGHGRHGPEYHEGSALAGMVGVGGGVHTIEKVLETGIDMEHIALGMRQTGATDAQVAEAKRVSEAGSKAFPNLSTLEIFEHINDLRGILGDMDKAIHEAPDILPEFSALKAKAGNRGAKSAVGEIYNAVKSAETANEITAEGVQKHVNSLTRLAFWYGDKLNPSQYFSAQKAGGQMLNLTSDRFRFGAFSALTQEIGQRAGTQFGTFAAKGVAGLKMTVAGLDRAAMFGLLDVSTIKRSKNNSVKPGAQFSDIGLDGVKYDRATDPDLWLYKNVIPKLKAGGVNTDDKAELLRELGRIFTDKNAYGFLFELAQQRTKIDKDWHGFVGTSGDFRSYLGKDPMAAVQGTQAQANALMTALSGPSIPGIVENLSKLNTGLASVAGFFEKHPLGAQATMGAGMGVVGGLATAGVVGLTVMAVSTLSLPALAIGTVAALTIAALTIPMKEIFGVSPKDLADGFEAMAKPGYSADGKMPDLTKGGDGKSSIDPAKLKEGAGSIWDSIKRGATSLWNAFGDVAEKGQAEQKKVAEGARDVAAGAREVGTAAPQAKSGLDSLGNSIMELMKKLVISEAVIGQISFNGGGGGGLGGLIQKASFGSDGAIGSFGGKALAVGAGSGIGHTASKAERAAYIRAAALRNGIDPETALRVAQSEGFNTYVGDKGTSFGDWQLHFGGSGIRGMNAGGLGDVLRRRGINAKDPSTWKQQTDFALEWAAKHGWGDWHGAKRVGIGNRQGIGTAPPTRPAVTVPPKSRELVAHLHTHLDGRKVASVVTRHQFDAANGPATGANFADASELYPQLG